MKQRGIALIELIILCAVGMIIVSIGLGFFGVVSGNSNISMGFNGMTESRCIEGYKFVIGERGQPRQILDEFGKGVRCDVKVN